MLLCWRREVLILITSNYVFPQTHQCLMNPCYNLKVVSGIPYQKVIQNTVFFIGMVNCIGIRGVLRMEVHMIYQQHWASWKCSCFDIWNIHHHWYLHAQETVTGLQVEQEDVPHVMLLSHSRVACYISLCMYSFAKFWKCMHCERQDEPNELEMTKHWLKQKGRKIPKMINELL